jgi:alkaline phosphatase D
MTRVRRTITRRRLLARAGAAGLIAIASPAISRGGQRPQFTHGVQSGDVDTTSGMVWTRADRPSRVLFEVATRESFADARRLAPLNALPESDFTVKRLIEGLAPDQQYFYRLTLEDLADTNLTSEPIVGRLRTAPAQRRDVRFAWSGDTVGQGYGIDDDGMLTYATIARHDPDFFLHSGDTIYADNPLKEELELPGGATWRNRIITDEKRKVAETLDEFRGQWKYNLLDRHVRALHAQIPTFFQWDDHEVLNNWSPSKDLSADARYTEKSIALLSARAARAFHEMLPVRLTPAEPSRIYRKIAYGPLLDVFFLDMRSYRGPNNAPMETTLSPAARLLGETQVEWLKRALAESKATWKIIAADMPLGLIVWDDFTKKAGVEAIADGEHGVPRGRELEIADLLSHIKRRRIANVVWLTADVHYTAAHHYHPSRAKFQDFDPFWEFVSGPLHAGTFGPGELDATFGPEVKFFKAPPKGQLNLPPSAGLQFFGLIDIDGRSEQMTVRLMDRANTQLWKTVLDPARQRRRTRA